MIRDYLPYPVQRELFGDRRRFGTKVDPTDADWKRWLEVMPVVYEDSQRPNSLSRRVNEAGYEVLREIPLAGLSLAEIGPGGGYHFAFFNGLPKQYHAIDIEARLLETVRERADSLGMPLQCHTVDSRQAGFPLATASQDIVLSFYSLEHLSPLAWWIDEINRVLKPGGRLIGAIPTEGGLAWGLGRWLTSRRALKKQFNLDLRKLICWEHVNFCDAILDELGRLGSIEMTTWPLRLPADLALVIRFVVTKPNA